MWKLNNNGFPAIHLKRAHGRVDPEWGMVQRLVRGKFEWDLNGGPDVLRTSNHHYCYTFEINAYLEHLDSTWFSRYQEVSLDG